MFGVRLQLEVNPQLHDIVLSPKFQCELTPVSQVRGKRGMKEVLRHIWRDVSLPLGGGDTVLVFLSFLFEYFVQFIKH